MGKNCTNKSGAKNNVAGKPREKVKSAEKKCEKKITNIRLISLEYLFGHHMLKDNEKDWINTGALYPLPDWAVAKDKPNPISFSMTERGKCKVTIEATPPDAPPEKGELAVYYKGGPLLFHKKNVTFNPKKNTEFVIEAEELFDQKVEAADLVLSWYAIAEKEITEWREIGTTNNLSFATIGKPIVEKRREDGVTYWRMASAVEWVSEANSMDELEILEHLFDKFDRYVLGISHLDAEEQRYLDNHPKMKKALEQVDWPTYFNPNFGAWPAIYYEYFGAECQAICRLNQGIMRQVGSSADIELVYVSADFSSPETPVEKTDGNQPTGPDPAKGYVMVDSEVQVGKVYWPPKKGEQSPVGWNNFEAYAKYKGPPPRYFGGGTGLLPEGSNPLHVFWGIAEYAWVSKTIAVHGRQTTKYGRQITSVHQYIK